MKFTNLVSTKAIAVVALCALGAFATPASADVIYKFDQDGCTGLCGLPNYGFVTLTDVAGGVHVKVNLLGGSGLIDTGALSFHTLAFNLAGAPTVTISDLPTLWEYTGPTTFSPNGGFGTFNYVIDSKRPAAPTIPGPMS